MAMKVLLMHSQSLIHEIFEAIAKARWLRPEERAYLERRGVDPDVIFGGDPQSQYCFADLWIPNPILTATVEICSGRFEFRPDGIPVLLTIAVGLDSEPVDIICWSRRLERLATWLDTPVSDASLINRPCLAEFDALPIAEDFLDWLASRRRKLLILDFARAAPDLWHRPLLARNAAHRRILVDRLTAKPNVIIGQHHIQGAA